MFSPSYLRNNGQALFAMPLNYKEKIDGSFHQVFAGDLHIHFKPDGNGFKLLGVYYREAEVTPLISYLERNCGTPLFPQIQDAIARRLEAMKTEAEPVENDHTLNLQ